MDFEAHYTKARQVMLGLLGLGFGAAGIWMLTLSAVDFEGSAARKIAGLGALFGASAETTGHAIGLIALFMGIAVLPIVLLNLRHKGPALRIDAQGIYAHRWSEQPIPWSNVAKVAPYSVQRQKFVGVTLIDPALNRKAGLFGKLSGANRALGYGDLALSVQGTDGQYDDLVEALLRHAHRFG
jgi:hypothetical protein